MYRSSFTLAFLANTLIFLPIARRHWAKKSEETKEASNNEIVRSSQKQRDSTRFKLTQISWVMA